jgi:hypothetical protein
MALVTTSRQIQFFGLEHNFSLRRAICLLTGGRPIFFLFIPLVLSFGVGCGYRFRGYSSEENPWAQEGIRTVYVRPMGNVTFKTGVEDYVFNSVVRTLASSGMFKVVFNARDADAELTGVVTGAGEGVDAAGGAHDSLAQSYNRLILESRDRGEVWNAPAPGVAAGSMEPVSPSVFGPLFNPYLGGVGWIYVVSVSCNFSLVRSRPMEGKKPLVWSGAIGRSTKIVSINQLGVFGATTSYFKESEVHRAYRELASRISGDLVETMSSQF